MLLRAGSRPAPVQAPTRLWLVESLADAPVHGVLLNLGILYEDREQYDKAKVCYKRILDVQHDQLAVVGVGELHVSPHSWVVASCSEPAPHR